MVNSNVFVIFGLTGVDKIIKEMIGELKAERIAFDLRLLITEGVTNAYYHGNRQRDELPICIRYQYDGIILNIEIEDSGEGFDESVLEERISSENLMSDNGRGIYLIKCFSEDVVVNLNKVIIRKLFIS